MIKASYYQIGLPKVIRLTLQSLIVGFAIASGGLKAQTLPLTRNLINFNSPKGEQLLLESNARQDYFPLSIHFVTQDNQAYCGVASIVMVLNALSLPAPEASEYPGYHLFTQKNFFNNLKTQQVVAAETVARQGMTLEEIEKLLESYPVQARAYHGSDLTLAEFRQLVKINLQQPDNFVLVNYLRRTIGQERGGHISPIAAYNEQSDRFLILDVSRYKYPPIWVKAEELWQALGTVDSVSGKTRGFVLINPRKSSKK